jgi:hypothetical protein
MIGMFLLKWFGFGGNCRLLHNAQHRKQVNWSQKSEVRGSLYNLNSSFATHLRGIRETRVMIVHDEDEDENEMKEQRKVQRTLTTCKFQQLVCMRKEEREEDIVVIQRCDNANPTMLECGIPIRQVLRCLSEIQKLKRTLKRRFRAVGHSDHPTSSYHWHTVFILDVFILFMHKRGYGKSTPASR